MYAISGTIPPVFKGGLENIAFKYDSFIQPEADQTSFSNNKDSSVPGSHALKLLMSFFTVEQDPMLIKTLSSCTETGGSTQLRSDHKETLYLGTEFSKLSLKYYIVSLEISDVVFCTH